MNKLINLNDIFKNFNEFNLSYTLYMPHGIEWNKDTVCAVLNSNDFENEDDPDIPKFAKENFLHEALSLRIIEDIIENAKMKNDNLSTDDLINAFIFYYDNDAFVVFD